MLKKKILLLLVILFLASCNSSKVPEGYYDVCFPIEFIAHSGLPKTRVEIQGHSYALMIDLGSSSVLSLDAEILSKIDKTPLETTHMVDLKGNRYKTEVFLIPEIKLGKMTASKITVDEESHDFLAKGALLGNSEERSKEEIAKEKPGRIGRALFENNTNLFLDFHNSVMYGCNELSNRKKNGYRIKKMVPISFDLNHKTGIVFQANTDLGLKRFMLDTGASRNLLKPSVLQEPIPGTSIYQTSLFGLGKKDFGPQEFLLFEIASSFDNIDGIIGMDFLKEHVVYLDFKKKIAHIGKASEVNSAIRPPSYATPKETVECKQEKTWEKGKDGTPRRVESFSKKWEWDFD